MIRALYSAASGMTAQQTNLDNIANNLANANTVGLQDAPRAVSRSACIKTWCSRGRPSGQQTVMPIGLQLGLGRARLRMRSSSPRAISRRPTIPWIW